MSMPTVKTRNRNATAKLLGIDPTTVVDWAVLLQVGMQHPTTKSWSFNDWEINQIARFRDMKDQYPNLEDRVNAFHGRDPLGGPDIFKVLEEVGLRKAIPVVYPFQEPTDSIGGGVLRGSVGHVPSEPVLKATITTQTPPAPPPGDTQDLILKTLQEILAELKHQRQNPFVSYPPVVYPPYQPHNPHTPRWDKDLWS
jgi:hypothetical protein